MRDKMRYSRSTLVELTQEDKAMLLRKKSQSNHGSAFLRGQVSQISLIRPAPAGCKEEPRLGLFSRILHHPRSMWILSGRRGKNFGSGGVPASSILPHHGLEGDAQRNAEFSNFRVLAIVY